MVRATFRALTPSQNALRFINNTSMRRRRTVSMTSRNHIVRIDNGRLNIPQTRTTITARMRIPTLLNNGRPSILTLNLNTLANTTKSHRLRFIQHTRTLMTILSRRNRNRTILRPMTTPNATSTKLRHTNQLTMNVPNFGSNFGRLTPSLQRLIRLNTRRISTLTANSLNMRLMLLHRLTSRSRFLNTSLTPNSA